MSKAKLQQQCKTLVLKSYSEGGMASDNEYNQFLCDIIGELITHLSVEGLKFLRDEAKRVRENMLDYDKLL
jgi:hypothetical protein